MEDLKKQSLKAIIWDLGGSFGQQAFSFIIGVFLARLLLPEEFGLVGMAMVFIAIFQVFSDVGFASALIHRQDTTSLTYSSVFYLNIFLGLVLTVLIYFGAPLIGHFYDNNDVTIVVRWLSLIFIFSSFNIVQKTLLRKDLDMKTLNIRIFLSQLLGGSVGIYMAFQGFGVYSLIGQTLVDHLVTTIFFWSVTDWYPKLEFSLKEIKKLTGYSSYIFFDSFFSKIFSRIDTLFIGKVFSAATLGFYSRAQSLNQAVIRYSSKTLQKVFFPVLSKLQDDDEKYFRIYYKLIAVVTFLAFGLTGILFVTGESLIILIYGQKWEPSVFIFQILILKAFGYPISIMVNNSFLSRGYSKENFWIGIFRKIVQLIPLAIGYYYGLNAFLIALVATSYFLITTNILFASYYVGSSTWRHFKWIFEGLVILGVTILLYYSLGPWTHIERFFIAIIFTITYFLTSYLRKHNGLLFLIKNGKELIKKYG